MKYELIAPRDPEASGLIQVLMNRGFNKNEIVHYLHTTDADLIDPQSIEHMQDGIDMLLKHIKNNDDIYVQCDADVDGYTSSAILINYLHRLYPDFVKNHIFYKMHTKKAHGINMEFITDNIKLVVAPDASSEEFEIHKELHDKNIDVLIIDHHNADGYSPWACVINNQISDYPNKALSGAGMVYKFCCALDKELNVNYADDFIDLAIFGIVADVMDMRTYENRRLADKATVCLKSPLLQALMAQNAFQNGNDVNIKAFSWTMAPPVNAVTRVGTDAEKMLLFESLLEYKAYEEIPSTKRGCKGQLETRVEQAARTCKNVKARQDRLRDASYIEAVNMVNNNDKIIIILRDQTTQEERNLTGLVANKLMSCYEKPILLLSREVEEDGTISWAGSGRNNSSYIPSLQEYLKNTGLVDFANGHDNAFGVKISDENVKKLLVYTNEKFNDVSDERSYRVDLIYQGNKIDTADIITLADSGNLWGEGITEPLVAIENLTLTNDKVDLSAKGYLTITINSELSLVKRGVTLEEFEKLSIPGGRVIINAVGACRRQAWDDKVVIDMVDYDIVFTYDFYF